jgi:hypothetical protein
MPIEQAPGSLGKIIEQIIAWYDAVESVLIA